MLNPFDDAVAKVRDMVIDRHVPVNYIALVVSAVAVTLPQRREVWRVLRGSATGGYGFQYSHGRDARRAAAELVPLATAESAAALRRIAEAAPEEILDLLMA